MDADADADAALSDKLHGEIVDLLVEEIMGDGTRVNRGCPTLSKKEALCLLAFVRFARRTPTVRGSMNGDK